MQAAPLRVRVLGGLTVEGIDQHALGSRKARMVLKILVLARGRPVPVDRLAHELWGDAPPSSPAEQVSVLVSRLRRTLGSDRLVRADAGYRLHVDWLDLDELAARVSEARDALASGRLGAARAAADSSIALARGEVLPEEDGEWAEADRARGTALATEARRILAEAAEKAGDHTAAAAAAEAALAADPYDEASLRILMHTHVALGRPASALAAYARVKDRLGEDLGVPPAPETEALHDAIVLGRAVGDRLGPDASEPRPAPPGRGAECAALDDALDRCRSSRLAHLVVIEGEAGIGKTTLLEAWLAKTRQHSTVLLGRARELARDLPLQPVTDALAAHLAGLGVDDRAALLAEEAGVLKPVLGVGGDQFGRGVTVVADAELERGRLFAALRAVVGRVATDRAAVLAVDDLHYAGRSTVAWLDFAAGLAAPVLLVAATRPAPELSLSGAIRIALGPLDVQAVGEIVGDDVAADVHARTGGNPLLMWALGQARPEGPRSLAEAVARRSHALGDAEATVRAAAVLGAEVDLDLLADVTQLPASVLLEHLERAVAAGLLVERGAGFAFRHDLERGEIELSTGSARRALVHRQAARALAARPAPDPLAVADHARLGGDTALAVAWYVRAADVAVGRADLDTAEAILGSALDLADTAEARAARARVRMAAGRLDEAAEDAARAVAGSRDPATLEIAGWVAYYRRRYDQARAFADEGVRRASDPAVRVSCLALGGRVRHGSGDLAGAATCLEAATGDDSATDLVSLPRVWLALARLHQGRPIEALSALPAVLDGMPHPFAPLHARFARAVALGQLGRVAEALAACDEFDVLVERSGAAGERLAGVAANCRAWVLRWSGRLEEADECNRRAVEQAAAVGMTEARYAGLLDLADGRLLAADADSAAGALAAMSEIEEWNGTMAWHQRHRFSLLQARLAWADADRDDAAQVALGVAADAAARGAHRYELLARALAALAGGRGSAEASVLDDVVAGLGRCAVMDGWWLVGLLAAEFDVPEWRKIADERVSRVAKSSPHPDSVGALAGRLLGS